MATKKPAAPNMEALLGKIADSRTSLPKSPIQAIAPIPQKPQLESAEEGLNVKTYKRINVNTSKLDKTLGGKPTNKQTGVKYARLSPRIPMDIKKQLDIAVIQNRYTDVHGQPIRYIDEFVSEAIRRMLTAKADREA